MSTSGQQKLSQFSKLIKLKLRLGGISTAQKKSSISCLGTQGQVTKVNRPIWLDFEIVQDFIPVQVICKKKKGKRKVQGVPQSQTAALPRPQEEVETDKSKQAQTEQTYEKH